MSEKSMMPDMNDVAAAVEAVLFASSRPVSMRSLCSILEEFDASQVREAVKVLRSRYRSPASGIELAEVAGGLVIRTRPGQKKYVVRARQKAPARLSRAAMETLALVAYRQPVTRAEVEAIRGVDSSGTLRFLMERRLIRIQGRKAVPGRPLLYGTTRYFLELFQLKNLKSLPDSTELKELEILSKGQLSLFDNQAGSGSRTEDKPASVSQDVQETITDTDHAAVMDTEQPLQEGHEDDVPAERRVEPPRLLQ